jgi:hypothetical protein
MSYRIAGIDVHKKILAVVVADVEVDGDYHFDRLKVGTRPPQLRALADWLVERDVEEVVMESTAQYWRPVWEVLERYWRPHRRSREGASLISGTLHLAQAQSNRGAGGRKKDFPDADQRANRRDDFVYWRHLSSGMAGDHTHHHDDRRRPLHKLRGRPVLRRKWPAVSHGVRDECW